MICELRGNYDVITLSSSGVVCTLLNKQEGSGEGKACPLTRVFGQCVWWFPAIVRRYRRGSDCRPDNLTKKLLYSSQLFTLAERCRYIKLYNVSN